MSDEPLPQRRRWLRWAIGSVAIALLVAVGWVAIRGISAVNDLQKIESSSSQLKKAIAKGDLDRARSLATRIAEYAESAHAQTSDPVWVAFGAVPWIGPNFSAIRDVADIADAVSTDALIPVLDVAGDFDITSLGLSDEGVDLAPFAEIEPPLATASTALSKAEKRALRIDADSTLQPLSTAIGKLRSQITEAATVVGSLHGAARLLPSMLGANEPRNYVLAMQNNAELRSSGGIIGAIALLRADNGRITLIQQASSRDFPRLEEPLALSDSTVALFDSQAGRYVQNLTSVPDFTEAGPAIATRWTDRFGTKVDGVIAVDAVTTKYLLRATGPLSFGSFKVDKDSVVDVLLSQIYAKIPDPVTQDKVFAEAASALLGAALSTADPQRLISALAESAEEDRIRIWSGHPEEEKLLMSSSLGGALPKDDAISHVGVLINDTTGGKMDYYTHAAISTAVGTCDGEPTTLVRVRWSNNAPADAATALPRYVTARGYYGVPAGSVRTLIAIYGPEGAIPVHVDRDGKTEAVQTARFGTRSAVQHEVLLAPGESSTITMEFRGETAGSRHTEVEHTPMISAPDIRREKLRCMG